MRKRNKAALQDRKSAASHARMQNVASLAVDVAGSRKRRKGNEGEVAVLPRGPLSEYLIAGMRFIQRTTLVPMMPTGRFTERSTSALLMSRRRKTLLGLVSSKSNYWSTTQHFPWNRHTLRFQQLLQSSWRRSALAIQKLTPGVTQGYISMSNVAECLRCGSLRVWRELIVQV